MRKNILIIGLVIITIISMAYGYTQRAEALYQREVAVEARIEAAEAREESERAREAAAQARRDALFQSFQAEEERKQTQESFLLLQQEIRNLRNNQ